MKAFDDLLQVADKLLSPNGCPWDLKQTFFTLQPYVLEEAHEVVEAVDSNEDAKIIEELGDLLYTVIFYGKLAHKENRFSMEDIVNTVKEKLIRRHPHVFGETKVGSVDDVVNNWEKIKREEKKEAPKSPLEGLPPTLPILMKAQKLVKKIKRSNSSLYLKLQKEAQLQEAELLSEEKIGEAILALLCKAEEADIDAESSLRRVLNSYEKRYLQEKEVS
jgi:MazG family protein